MKNTVASYFYAHGLFCATYQGTVICFSMVIVILFSLPLINILSGDLYSPLAWDSPWFNYRVLHSPSDISWMQNMSKPGPLPIIPSWFVGEPLAVFQQMIVQVKIDCGRHFRLCAAPQEAISEAASIYVLLKLKEANSKCASLVHPVTKQLLRDKFGDYPEFPLSAISPAMLILKHKTSDESPMTTQQDHTALYSK